MTVPPSVPNSARTRSVWYIDGIQGGLEAAMSKSRSIPCPDWSRCLPPGRLTGKKTTELLVQMSVTAPAPDPAIALMIIKLHGVLPLSDRYVYNRSRPWSVHAQPDSAGS
jgi:hypothetical protein